MHIQTKATTNLFTATPKPKSRSQIFRFDQCLYKYSVFQIFFLTFVRCCMIASVITSDRIKLRLTQMDKLTPQAKQYKVRERSHLCWPFIVNRASLSNRCEGLKLRTNYFFKGMRSLYGQ